MKLVLSLIYVLPAVLCGQKVLINEILSSNGSVIADEDGDNADWIELKNLESYAVNLAGWGISDREDNPYKWTIPSVVIEAQGRTLIWASGKDRAGTELHTNFNLSAEGETVVLTRPDGSTSDWVEVIPLPRDISYGRYPDGGTSLGYFANPTPGVANPSVASDIVTGAPQFSHQRGFYERPFYLELWHSDAEADIYYTMDGSEPTVGTSIFYSGQILVTGTSVIRAAAFRSGAEPVYNTGTATYLFLDEIISRGHSAPAGYPGSWWSSVSDAHVSYGQSPVVMAYPGYAERMKEALLHLPSVSLVIPVSDLFGSSGIYSNPTRTVSEHGEQWEKASSMEWIDPNSGTGFQVGAGLRIQGAGSRGEDSTPKKSFRVLFKGEYGTGRLNVPVLAEKGTLVEDYNTLIFRAEYNNSWLHWASEQREFGLYFVDQWIKDRQQAMNGISSGGRHVHLFLNGMYWGIYNLTERPDAAWAASYLGGEREDYDAVGWRGMRDGHWERWQQEIGTATERDLSINGNYELVQQYLDIDHFIDYMLLQMFVGNDDWPRNNWTAIRHREDGRVLHISWDSERTFEDVNINRVNVADRRLVGDPGTFYVPLRNNAEFRLRFADRARRHLFNGGVLAAETTKASMIAAAADLKPAMFAEEARWGAYRKEIRERRSPSYYYGVESHWEPALERLLDEYLPQRPAILIGQLREVGLYPEVDAPEFSMSGGAFAPGSALSIGNSGGDGVIWYTTDGSDPRVAYQSTVSSNAQMYSGSITLSTAVVVSARVLLNGSSWSALTQMYFYPDESGLILLPGGTADWTLVASWSGTHFPNGAGTTARIPGPSPDADRNINIRTPLVTGNIYFDQGHSLFRNRVRDRDEGNTLTFDGGSVPALVQVNGTGTGFVEFEVVAGVELATDLLLDIRNVIGDPEHGALRLREKWQGPGGLIKQGLGVASMTGEDKNFTGRIVIEEGVLQVTESSTPRYASGVSVEPGGQLRLISGSGDGDWRSYSFGGMVQINSEGRSSAITGGSGLGVLGALRYDPGNTDNHAVLTNTVRLEGESSLHVDGSRNTLELSGKLQGSHGFTKSGGGMLLLSAANFNFNAPVVVDNGILGIHYGIGSPLEVNEEGLLTGFGKTGPIAGIGKVLVDRTILEALTAEGLSYNFVFSRSGSPLYFFPEAAGNGLLRLESAPESVGSIHIYIEGVVPEFGSTVYNGGFFVPETEDLEAAIAGSMIHVFVQDAEGEHDFGGESWRSVSNAEISVISEAALFREGHASGKTLQVLLQSLPMEFSGWREQNFPNEEDRENPLVSGPFAMPGNSEISNMLRYAFAIDLNEDPASKLPSIDLDGAAPEVSFVYQNNLTDLVYIAESSDDLINWDVVIFDSRTDVAVPGEDGRIYIKDAGFSMSGGRQFYRVRVFFK